ncbi:DUF4199 family protein [Nibribacter ruber]|uniref:DUF4199 family protein n=1 Tax=Nibribacter ruber TaxID=2698458 RepID=A0A6P1P1S3_9BACT|nr:DUF4199 domain-containing protein [Nibribacter ruber]QHL87712.1 DUF4199 family protein [Nibribacter ruber]
MDNSVTASNPSVTTVSVGIRYGLITGLVSALYLVILYLTDNSTTWWLGLLGIVIPIVGMVQAFKHFREANGGLMSYGQAIGIGTLMGLVSGIITAITAYVYIEFVDPSVLEALKAGQIEMLEKFNLPEDKLDEEIAKLEESTTAGKQALSSLIGGPVGGFILSLIIGAIMKKKRPEFE